MEAGRADRFMKPERLGTLPANIIGMDAMPDRQRYLALIDHPVGTGSLTVVQNWQAGLKKP